MANIVGGQSGASAASIEAATMPLSETALERIEAVISADVAVQVAEKAFYDLWGELERSNPDLFRALDGSFVRVLLAHRQACWADGWQCGRNPDRLVFMLAATLSTEPIHRETQMLSQQSESTYTTLRPGIDHEAFSRYLELVQHSADTGVPLPLSPAAIMQLEDQGAIVDLETGAIAWPQEVQCYE